MTYTQMASLSLNQVLMRSINTSLTAVLPVLSILVVGSLLFGATTLQEFGIALLVGLVIGVYSSIFVATPITAMLNERRSQYRLVRERLAGRSADGSRARIAEDSATELETAAARAAAAGKKLPAGYSASHPPRPRKARRR
jgi:preprotein translocase subunit SecF